MNSEEKSTPKRIVINTIFLYIRSIVIMAVSLYTSRIVLSTLGIDNYGIYNVVGGFVGMFSILSSSLVNASQRFLSFELGKFDTHMNKVFCNTVSVHLLLALAMFVVFETVGLWLMNTYLNIPEGRMTAANWVYQCSIFAFCINIISVPYNALIIAYERMSAFAYICIFEVIAKFAIVYLLFISPFDMLVFYALLLLAVSIIMRLIYGIYATKHFPESKFKYRIDKDLVKSILSFSGWNFLGSTASVLVTQGINMLINISFGVALNAARGIAEQVNNAINQFVTNFMTAMNPQITKSFASGEYKYMNTLMIRGAKYAALLYWFICLTVFIETEYILSIWLVEVPPYAPVFLRLVIIFSIFQALSNTLYIGMLATGDIKKYQIIMSALYVGSFILCYVFFKVGLGPEFGYISTIIAVILGVVVRLWLLKDMIPMFSIKDYLMGAVFKSGFVIVLSTIVVWGISLQFQDQSFLQFLIVLLSSVIVISLLIYTTALDKKERGLLRNQIKNRF